MRVSGLMQVGTAEPVSRGQILDFPCPLDCKKDWHLMPNLLKMISTRRKTM